MANTCIIPENEHWQFRECFSWFDRDGDGFIGAVDLPAALRAMGQYWSLYELKNLMLEFPPNTQLNYREFMKICERKYGIVPSSQDIEKAFEVFDQTGSGFISLDYVRHVLCSVGEQLSHSEFEELCSINGLSCTNENQTIDKETFLKIFGVHKN
ncbi:calmodulin-beta-like [Hylaeus volcanicus]|uniref:calmodulin-beta-like n=1 Tax=Hylaeus volcanicus TaxID=313075 RepID=UPI0023B80082|nr:calmodulin-beta-like [Hylaeus volcanicus]